MSEKRLTRSKNDRMFLGVAGGLGEYFDLDPVLIRLFFVLFGLATPHAHALIVYFLLAILMPEQKTVAKANAFDEQEIVIKDA